MRRRLYACWALACAWTFPLSGQTAEPLIQLSDRGSFAYNLGEAYTEGSGPYAGEITAGEDDAIVIELRYNVPIEVRLVGATATNQLALRQANGTVTTVRVLCAWADLDAPVSQRAYSSFPCYASGMSGPPAPPAGITKRVALRVWATTLPAPQGSVPAGFYNGSAYFRVDAR